MTNQKLTVVAQMRAKEGKTAFVKSELLKLLAPTRAEEGCINYDLHQDNNDSDLFLFYENWDSYDLWQKHNVSKHLTAFKKATEDAIAEVTVIQLTDIG